MKKTSWKTTVCGLATVLPVLGALLAAQFDDDPNTVPDWNQLVVVAAGTGLIFARDNNKTSEQVGAR